MTELIWTEWAGTTRVRKQASGWALWGDLVVCRLLPGLREHVSHSG